MIPIKVFLSYSHKDEELREQLENHLGSLKKEGIINNWHFRKIAPGNEWKDKIDRNLENSNIILLLISSDFMASLGARGGDLGLFLIKELSPQLKKVVENMKAGEFSAIIDMDKGYQILYVEKIIEATSKSVEEVRGEIEDILFKELINDKYQEWLENLRERSFIKIIQ